MKKQARKPSVQFASDGFRVLTRETLTEAEWNFTAFAEMNIPTACRALDYELARECETAHRFCADFLWRVKNPKGGEEFRAKWPHYPLHGIVNPSWVAIFPMPLLATPVSKHSCTVEKLEDVDEVSADMFARLEEWHRPHETIHRLVIDWSKGKGHAKAALLKWFASIPKQPARSVTQRRRAPFQLAKDAAAQLSAWRARRAGLSHNEYRTLLAKAGFKLDGEGHKSGFVRGYSDPSAYRNAAEKGELRVAQANEHISGMKGSWFTDYQPL